jgi:hypothetical protein
MVLDSLTDLGNANFQDVRASEISFGVTDVGGVVYAPSPPGTPVRLIREPETAFARRQPALRGDTFFWEAHTSTSGVIRSEQWVVRGSEPPRSLVSPGPSAMVVGFDTDGERMAWVVGYDFNLSTYEFARGEFWTAPFTADPAALRPRRVMSFDHAALVAEAMDASYYVFTFGGGETWLFNLVEGTYWTIRPPSSVRIDRPLFVNHEEVGFEVEPAGGGCQNVVRVQISSLGAPHPAVDAGVPDA